MQNCEQWCACASTVVLWEMIKSTYFVSRSWGILCMQSQWEEFLWCFTVSPIIFQLFTHLHLHLHHWVHHLHEQDVNELQECVQKLNVLVFFTYVYNCKCFYIGCNTAVCGMSVSSQMISILFVNFCFCCFAGLTIKFETLNFLNYAMVPAPCEGVTCRKLENIWYL